MGTEAFIDIVEYVIAAMCIIATIAIPLKKFKRK